MLIQEMLSAQENFSDAEKTIADYFLREKENIHKQGTREIAGKIFVSPSSIIRFCQKIGFDGLNSFREEYLEELRYTSRRFVKADPNRPFGKDDPELAVAGRIAGLYQETIQDTLSLLDQNTLTEAVRILNKPTVYIVTLSKAHCSPKSLTECVVFITEDMSFSYTLTLYTLVSFFCQAAAYTFSPVIGAYRHVMNKTSSAVMTCKYGSYDFSADNSHK